MTETIGVVRGETQYGMGGLMTASLASVLRDLGYATREFDGARLEQDIATLRQANVAAILAYNGMLVDAGGATGGTVWDRAGIPCIAWLVDHPIYHVWRFRSEPALLVAACVDETHSRFVRDWGVCRSSVELHHFAVGDLDVSDPVERDIDVLLAATLRDPETLSSEWNGLPSELRWLVEQSTAELLARPGADLVEVITAVCEAGGIVAPHELGAAVGVTFAHADRYVRARRRADLLELLADAGIVVDQIGHADAAYPALRCHRAHGPVAAIEVLDWMRRARVVLNAGLNFTAGSHERVLTAQGQGAVVMTEENGYWRRLLNEGVSGLLFDWGDLESVPSRLTTLLGDDDRLELMRQNGRRIAQESVVRAGDEAVAAVQSALRLRDAAS